MKDESEAESCMISGFIKVFKNLHQYKFNGSFEGWIRKIMVNECLMELRKRRNFNISIEVVSDKLIESFTIDQELHSKDIIQLLDYLPYGYRTVFNLFVIEQYSHEEIADKLGISINTSKSQLVKARTRLKQYIQQLNIAI
jgi:RNA polymerase sigma-70 factor (ECF subfamily)